MSRQRSGLTSAAMRYCMISSPLLTEHGRSRSGSATTIPRTLRSSRARTSCSTSETTHTTIRSAITATMQRSTTRCSRGSTAPSLALSHLTHLRPPRRTPSAAIRLSKPPTATSIWAVTSGTPRAANSAAGTRAAQSKRSIPCRLIISTTRPSARAFQRRTTAS